MAYDDKPINPATGEEIICYPDPPESVIRQDGGQGATTDAAAAVGVDSSTTVNFSLGD